MVYTRTFNHIQKNQAHIAGGKGASLGEMINTGIPVPPGFVILASAFDRFLEETDLDVELEHILTEELNHNDMNTVEDVSEKIRDLILKARIPADISVEIQKAFLKLKTPLVAVRSSATAEDSSIASWAGELESYLNVTNKNLLESVKKCWASLFTPRAIFYRFEKKLHKTKVSVAVVVQKMVQSDASGIAFTVHPVTKDKNQMVIEAGYGLGEAIVGGMITPDTYVIHKKQLDIVDKNISEQKMMIVRSTKGTKETKVVQSKQNRQKISVSQIKELAKLAIRIEKHYKKPQDIEFAIEKKKVYIVQSRPITTL